ncbi:MAG: hypothetical protein IPL99_12160 [Candidatus Competibacteraceae bacterium]|nr:hypothetical protein [Candidatus Competibacteraceae bacterium]
MSNEAQPEPFRNLSASFNERTTGSRVEFAKWREANPNFTHTSLMDNWKRIRIAWGVSEPDKKRAKK